MPLLPTLQRQLRWHPRRREANGLHASLHTNNNHYDKEHCHRHGKSDDYERHGDNGGRRENHGALCDRCAGLQLKFVEEANVSGADEGKDERELAASCKNSVLRPLVRRDAQQHHKRGNTKEQRDNKAEKRLLGWDEQHPTDQKVAAT